MKRIFGVIIAVLVLAMVAIVAFFLSKTDNKASASAEPTTADIAMAKIEQKLDSMSSRLDELETTNAVVEQPAEEETVEEQPAEEIFETPVEEEQVVVFPNGVTAQLITNLEAESFISWNELLKRLKADYNGVKTVITVDAATAEAEGRRVHVDIANGALSSQLQTGAAPMLLADGQIVGIDVDTNVLVDAETVAVNRTVVGSTGAAYKLVNGHWAINQKNTSQKVFSKAAVDGNLIAVDGTLTKAEQLAGSIDLYKVEEGRFVWVIYTYTEGTPAKARESHHRENNRDDQPVQEPDQPVQEPDQPVQEPDQPAEQPTVQPTVKPENNSMPEGNPVAQNQQENNSMPAGNPVSTGSGQKTDAEVPFNFDTQPSGETIDPSQGSGQKTDAEVPFNFDTQPSGEVVNENTTMPGDPAANTTSDSNIVCGEGEVVKDSEKIQFNFGDDNCNQVSSNVVEETVSYEMETNETTGENNAPQNWL